MTNNISQILYYNLYFRRGQTRFEMEQPEIVKGKFKKEFHSDYKIKYKWFKSLLNLDYDTNDELIPILQTDNFFNIEEKEEIISILERKKINPKIKVFEIIQNDRVINWLIIIKKVDNV